MTVPAAVDAVVTHHTDPFRSGVARFNELLAERLRVPVLPLEALASAEVSLPLLSFKASELPDDAAEEAGRALAGARFAWDVFLHEFRDLELERAIVRGARRVYCGNRAIAEQVDSLAADCRTLWAPGNVLDDRRFRPSEVSVFSFGMAHKIQTPLYRRLRELLEDGGASYAVYVSAANHEAASLRDSAEVFAEMHEIFPDTLYFLGNLSDVAVYNNLVSTTFFAAFFDGGVRANNSTVSSALERGAVVVTNLDRHSPPELVHMENVIDINRCERLPSDPLELLRLRASAMELGRSRGWDSLVRALRD